MNWKRFYKLSKKYWLILLIGLIETLIISTLRPLNSYIFLFVLNAFNKQGENLLQRVYHWSDIVFTSRIIKSFLRCFAKHRIICKNLLSYKSKGKMFKSILFQKNFKNCLFRWTKWKSKYWNGWKWKWKRSYFK